MKQRDRVAMAAEEVAAFLAGSRKLQLATINRDGTPHLVTMYYVMLDGQITFWTYRASQKARNLARDPRITCLVETGNEYFDLRGVQVQGVVRTVEDPAGVLEIGRRIAGVTPTCTRAWPTTTSSTPRASASATSSSRPGSISWDHSKLLPPDGAGSPGVGRGDREGRAGRRQAQSAWLASRAPSAIAASFAQVDLRVDRGRAGERGEAAVAAGQDVLPADQPRVALDPLRDQFAGAPRSWSSSRSRPG